MGRSSDDVRRLETDLSQHLADIDDFMGEVESSFPITGELKAIEQQLKSIMQPTAGIAYRHMHTGAGVELLLVFDPLMVDVKLLTSITDKLSGAALPKDIDLGDILRILPAHVVSTVHDIREFVSSVLKGSLAFSVAGGSIAYSIDVKAPAHRSISASTVDPAVLGPHDGFIEDSKTNLELIRKRIQSPRLREKRLVIGSASSTKVHLMYLSGVASAQAITMVVDRLRRIKTEGVLESNYLVEWISSRSVFPTVERTDRPDTAASALLEGRIVIVTDGTPLVSIVPATFADFLKASDDYYQNWRVSTMIRFVRLLGLLMGLYLPAIYVAIASFHQEFIPTPLLKTLAAARENVPLPSLAEVFVMLLLFEIIREAGSRVPQGIGQALTIGGTLVVGQAAVKAGFISAPIIIVGSAVVISLYAVTSYDMQQVVRFATYPLLIAAGTLGAYGLAFATIMLLLYLASRDSLGVPYLSPAAPLYGQGLKDLIYRAPWREMGRRLAREGAPSARRIRMVRRRP